MKICSAKLRKSRKVQFCAKWILRTKEKNLVFFRKNFANGTPFNFHHSFELSFTIFLNVYMIPDENILRFLCFLFLIFFLFIHLSINFTYLTADVDILTFLYSLFFLSSFLLDFFVRYPSSLPAASFRTICISLTLGVREVCPFLRAIRSWRMETLIQSRSIYYSWPLQNICIFLINL